MSMKQSNYKLPAGKVLLNGQAAILKLPKCQKDMLNPVSYTHLTLPTKCNITVTDYSNVVFADSYQWDGIYVFSDDIGEDGWYIKFRPEKTGYIRIKSLENSADISLIDKDAYFVSNDCTVRHDEYDSEDVIWGVKKGQAYYLYVSSVYLSLIHI